jgi:hypothetical protein
MMVCKSAEENAADMPDIGAWSSWAKEAEEKNQSLSPLLWGAALALLVLFLASGGDEGGERR